MRRRCRLSRGRCGCLDVGGSIKFWKILGLAARDDIDFTILNIVPRRDDEDSRFNDLDGDARGSVAIW